MNTLEQDLFEHSAFVRKIFPESTFESTLIHLEEEIAEVRQSHSEGKEFEVVEEIADCILCLISAATKEGIGICQIIYAIKHKIAVNKNRTWVKNPDNTYSHVKE